MEELKRQECTGKGWLVLFCFLFQRKAGTELVKENISNCHGRTWAPGHTGDRGRVDHDPGNSVDESSLEVCGSRDGAGPESRP